MAPWTQITVFLISHFTRRVGVIFTAHFYVALSMAVSALRFRGLWEDEMFARQHSHQLYVHTRRVRVTFRFTDRCYAVAWSRANQTVAGLERPCLCESQNGSTQFTVPRLMRARPAGRASIVASMRTRKYSYRTPTSQSNKRQVKSLPVHRQPIIF